MHKGYRETYGNQHKETGMAGTKDIKGVEQKVLKTFKKELPSVYFSDKSRKEYEEWTAKTYNLFHNLLNFPPKMFEGASLIDFGAGTGENTVQFSDWGAQCTLVDANDEACAIARNVFDQYAKNPEKHEIICSSIFDFDSEKKFDIVFTNGVLHHTDDKEGAFDKIASLLKPGGYFIFGIGNKVGGFQNMLQRMIVFSFAHTDEQMVDVSEKLFKEDIDRSVAFTGRSRRSTIFDRFVVQKQDDPTVSDVLEWFERNSLKFYSSWPKFIPPVLRDSDLNPPTFDPLRFKDIGVYSESFWMINQDNDASQVPDICSSFKAFSKAQYAMADYVNDFNIEDKLDPELLQQMAKEYFSTLKEVELTRYLQGKHALLFEELDQVLSLVSEKNLEKLADYLKTTKILFRGANGLRHMYYIGYKQGG